MGWGGNNQNVEENLNEISDSLQYSFQKACMEVCGFKNLSTNCHKIPEI
jgi:hypothetical protein